MTEPCAHPAEEVMECDHGLSMCNLCGAHVNKALAAIERDLQRMRDRAGAPREAQLGCSTVSHNRLGYCGGCVRALRDGGPNGKDLELLGWRLLALREVEQNA